jgi:hypothetical protein
MVGSQMQHAQRASGEKAALGRLDAARKDFLEIVRAKQNGQVHSVWWIFK